MARLRDCPSLDERRPLRAPAKRFAHNPQRKRPFTDRYVHDPRAYRSGLEERAAAQIRAAGLPVYFEVYRVPFTEPAKARHYTPDLTLPSGIILETKGLFQTADRQKHVYVRQQHPDLDIRFVFSNAHARIAKNSKTTYAAWADKQGFQWAHKTIPVEWLSEAPNLASLAALRSLGWDTTRCPR